MRSLKVVLRCREERLRAEGVPGADAEGVAEDCETAARTVARVAAKILGARQDAVCATAWATSPFPSLFSCQKEIII